MRRYCSCGTAFTRGLPPITLLALWREMLYAADYFRIPPNRVIELGTQVEI